jgi:hypothetical protein
MHTYGVSLSSLASGHSTGGRFTLAWVTIPLFITTAAGLGEGSYGLFAVSTWSLLMYPAKMHLWPSYCR